MWIKICLCVQHKPKGFIVSFLLKMAEMYFLLSTGSETAQIFSLTNWLFIDYQPCLSSTTLITDYKHNHSHASVLLQSLSHVPFRVWIEFPFLKCTRIRSSIVIQTCKRLFLELDLWLCYCWNLDLNIFLFWELQIHKFRLTVDKQSYLNKSIIRHILVLGAADPQIQAHCGQTILFK